MISVKHLVVPFILFYLTVFSYAVEYDRLGGWESVKSEATTYFYVQPIDGVWWFIDPGGNGFISKGVNHISYFGDHSPELGYSPYRRLVSDKYGSAGKWAKAAAKNLRRWNFNTVGAWSSEAMFKQEMAYTVILNIANQAGANWEKGIFPDVFSRRFQQATRAAVRVKCRMLKNDWHLLGYFTDNELRWGPDWRSKKSLLEDYLQFDRDSEGFKRAIQFIKDRYGKVEILNKAWGIDAESFGALPLAMPFPKSEERSETEAGFQKLIAETYFRTCREEILNADPNHLILGCRFAGYAPKPVLEAVGQYVDVVSFNTYNDTPPHETLDRIYKITGRPIMITEFSFKAMDSGLPNTKGAGNPVKTQQDRAKHFTQFVTELMKIPYVIGYHWFEYTDEPAEGRFDGENSNFGLVNIKDEPWEILTKEMTRTNTQVEAIHLSSKKEDE